MDFRPLRHCSSRVPRYLSFLLFLEVFVSRLLLLATQPNRQCSASPSDLFSEPSRQLASSTAVSSALIDTLRECGSDAYVLVSQPGVSAKDFRDAKAAPHLAKRMAENGDAFRFAVPEVIGGLGSSELQKVQKHLEEHCGAQTTSLDAASKNSSCLCGLTT